MNQRRNRMEKRTMWGILGWAALGCIACMTVACASEATEGTGSVVVQQGSGVRTLEDEPPPGDPYAAPPPTQEAERLPSPPPLPSEPAPTASPSTSNPTSNNTQVIQVKP